MFTNILVGVDGRDEDHSPIQLAEQLAAPHATIVLGNVRSGAHVSPGVHHAHAPQNHEESLELLLRQQRRSAIHATLASTDAPSVGEGLHQLAALHGADLLIIGASLYGDFPGPLVGRDARATLQGARVPVAIAPFLWRSPEHTMRVGVVGGGAGPEVAAAADALKAHKGTSMHPKFVASPTVIPDLDPSTPQSAVDLGECSRQLDLLVIGSESFQHLDRMLTGPPVPAGGRPGRPIGSIHCPLLIVPAHHASAEAA